MNPTTRSLIGSHLALTSVAIFYGVNYFTIKWTFADGLNNFEVLGVRTAVATSVFFLFHFFTIREKIQQTKDYLLLAICGLFGVAMNQTFFLWGISLTSPINASVLMITVPIFVFLLAWGLKEEKMTLQKLLGLLLAGGGALGLVLLREPSGGNSTSNWLGDLFIVINACSYAAYLVLVRPLILRYNAFTIVKWIFLFGGVPNMILGSFFFQADHWAQISNDGLFGLIFLILAATLGAYFLNAWAMKTLPSSSVGIYIYVQPVFVTLLTAFQQSGGLNLVKIQFILLIFGGVFLVTARRRFLQLRRDKL